MCTSQHVYQSQNLSQVKIIYLASLNCFDDDKFRGFINCSGIIEKSNSSAHKLHDISTWCTIRHLELADALLQLGSQDIFQFN